jgi:hypothetical protein
VSTAEKVQVTKEPNKKSNHHSLKTGHFSGQAIHAQLVNVKIEPSKLLLVAVLAIHLLVALSIFLTNFVVWQKLLLVFLLLSNVSHYFWTWLKAPTYRLQKTGDSFRFLGNVQQDSAQKDNYLDIQHCYYWSNLLLIFVVKPRNKKKHYFPILKDCCSEESFHYLKLISRKM